jgi:hypothetical protein
MIMFTPNLDANGRMPSVTHRQDGYRPGERVWVHRSGSWRPGIVLHLSLEAVTVRYRPAEGRGTGVDTVTGQSLAVRNDDDPFLDHLIADGQAGTRAPTALPQR